MIVDASMPGDDPCRGKMVRADAEGHQSRQPESTFRIYQEMINFCKTNGAFRSHHDGHRSQRRPDGAEG